MECSLLLTQAGLHQRLGPTSSSTSVWYFLFSSDFLGNQYSKRQNFPLNCKRCFSDQFITRRLWSECSCLLPLLALSQSLVPCSEPESKCIVLWLNFQNKHIITYFQVTHLSVLTLLPALLSCSCSCLVPEPATESNRIVMSNKFEN